MKSAKSGLFPFVKAEPKRKIKRVSASKDKMYLSINPNNQILISNALKISMGLKDGDKVMFYKYNKNSPPWYIQKDNPKGCHEVRMQKNCSMIVLDSSSVSKAILKGRNVRRQEKNGEKQFVIRITVTRLTGKGSDLYLLGEGGERIKNRGHLHE